MNDFNVRVRPTVLRLFAYIPIDYFDKCKANRNRMVAEKTTADLLKTAVDEKVQN